MQQLSIRFYLSNILTAILLIFSAPHWRAMNKEMNSRGSDFWYGLFLYFILILGIYSSVLKGYDLAHRTRNNFKWFEKLFIVIIYLISLASTGIFLAVAVNYMLPIEDQFRKEMMFLIVLTLLVAFIALVLEGFYLEHRPKKPLNKVKQKIADYGTALYSSLGITICWNAFIIGGSIKFYPSLLSTLQFVLLMLLLVFPFQRLFWYEVMGEAETKIDHLRTFLAILFVLASGIIPLFFI